MQFMKQICMWCCAGALLAGAASCSDLEEAGGARHSGAEVRLVASADGFTPQTESRTQVGGIAANGALQIEWVPGDRIGVFGPEGSNLPFVNAGTQPSSVATFESESNAAVTPQYVYYPYSQEATDPMAVPVSIPAVQTYADESSVAQYDIKAADVLADEGSGTYSLQFRQMAALVRFEIDLSGVSSLASDERLREITVSREDASVPMAGEFTYSLASLDAGLQPGERPANYITLSLANPPAVSEKITAYAVVAPGAHEGKEWQCVFFTDRHQVTFRTTALCNFEAGRYYTVPLNVVILENNDATFEEIDDSLDPEEETANCYVVTAPGEYDFKATVIGNGEKGIIKGAGFHTEDPYINPKSAKVLWSDKENFVSDVRLENGRVHYTVPESVAVNGIISGNAVIAVYSEPDCQGEILWSWHIWGTNAGMQDEVYTNQAGATFTVLDRELGASRPGNGGTLYQWGRKDPIPNVGVTRYFLDGTTLTEINTNFGWAKVMIDNATIEDAIRHPMELVAGGATQATQHNWLGVFNPYLWGDAGRELPEDLRDPKAGAGWNQQKTIYDPSPVGYRVANIFTFSGFTDMPSGSTKLVYDEDGDIDVAGRLEHINYVKRKSYWYFMKNADDTEGTYYQDIRSRDGYMGYEKKNAGSGGYWWAAEAYQGEDGKAYACYLNTDSYKSGSVVAGSTSGNIINTYGRDKTLLRDAYAVRCVREE